MKRIFNFLLAGTALLVVMNGLEACSKKSTSSKTTVTTAAEPAAKETTPPPPLPVEEKDGMQITRDAAGNFVIHLVVINLEPVKLMKPVKEGYVVWMTNESGVTSNIGTIEGANTWTARKDKSKFEATSAVKPSKVFITAETDLKVVTPGKQVVWSTGNF
ncbi:MAG: hypothetical protein IPN43_15895 [Chitinophagaceae bacterium]|nr:hypothetical protein [Chitinophagaceae bacterium]